MTLRSRLFFAVAAPLFLFTLWLSPLAPSEPARAAASCSLVFNLFDADATNGTSSTPGGSSATIAAPGFTNNPIVGIDIKSASGAACASQSRAGGWYVFFSRWVGSLFGKKLDWTAASIENSNNYAQVDQVPSAQVTTSVVNDGKNDFGAGISVGATAAAFDLAAAGTATLTSGSTVTVYGDLTTCAVSQGATKGFAPAYVRRTAGDLGAWYWLNNATGNANSSYLAAAGGAATQGGGGKGGCLTLAPTHSTDTIVFDDTAPEIADFTSTTGGGTTTLIVTLDTSSVTDVGAGLWLMAFTNSPDCDGGTGSWSPWEPYAASRSGWDLSSTVYGGSGATTEGDRRVCIRVVDKAGNIAVAETLIRYDKTPPAVIAFSSALTSTYGVTSYPYTLTFSERIGGLRSNDFSNVGTATGCSFAPSSGSGTTFTITVSGCSATGTLTPRLALGAVSDAANNVGPAAATVATTTLTLGEKPPLATLVLATASDSGASPTDRLTKAAALTYVITFDESVTGLGAADFATTGSTARGCTPGTPVGSGKTYSITLTKCGEGTLILGLVAGAVVDADKLANLAAVAQATTIDRSGPTLNARCIVEDVAGLRPACPYGTQEPVRLLFTAGDATAGLDDGALLLPADLSGCDETDTELLPGTSQGVGVLCTAEGRYTPTVTVVDRAGNSTTASVKVVIDTTAPAVTIRCALSRAGSYGTCPSGTVRATRYVKLIATDAGAGLAGKALAATSNRSCTLLSSSLTSGSRQWKLYRCDARRTFALRAAVIDRAGNGPVSAAADWRKR